MSKRHPRARPPSPYATVPRGLSWYQEVAEYRRGTPTIGVMPEEKMMRNHKIGRPPAGSTEVLALTRDGRWIEDDGRPHVAFSLKASDGWPVALWAECRCSIGDDSCPGRQAMHKTAERWSCANGQRFK